MIEVSLKVFCSYSHKDEFLRKELENHLSVFTHQGKISIWHDGKIMPGEVWDRQIKDNLNTADIILLLVSSDFMASLYCWEVEVTKAIERHNRGDACVIPIILRSVVWKSAPFACIQGLPKDVQNNILPVKLWTDQDAAFTNVAEGFWKAAEKLIVRKQKLNQQEETETLQRLREQEEVERIRQNELPSDKGVSYTRLRDLLKAGEWKEADQETRKVMLKAASREKEGWLYIDSIEQFPCTDLRTIDQLWVKYSSGRFGFSVQKRIWESMGGNPKANYEAWCKFGDRVGWRNEGVWWPETRTFSVKAPEGHLPENVLRYVHHRVVISPSSQPGEVLSSLALRFVECNI